MATDCYGEDGTPVRAEVGELVVTRPWPGMTAGCWKDAERYLETEDRYWFIHGRSDDALKIAGKRIGPAGIESLLVGHLAVNEAAAIGVPHEIKTILGGRGRPRRGGPRLQSRCVDRA